MPTPFWEETYQDAELLSFGFAPNASLVEYRSVFDPVAPALDVGCGEGKNIVYLARQGFRSVEGIDLSPNAVAKARLMCERFGAAADLRVADLREFAFEHEYGTVTSFGTLHFVTREEWRAFLVRAKAHTLSGGFHVMQIFTDSVPASPDIAPFAVGLAREGELRDVYRDWDVLEFKAYTFEDEHPGVPKHTHASNKIVARKPA